MEELFVCIKYNLLYLLFQYDSIFMLRLEHPRWMDICAHYKCSY